MPLLTASIWIVLSFPSLYPLMNSKSGLAGRQITVIRFPSLIIVGLTDFLYSDSTELSLTLSLNEFQIGPCQSSDYHFCYCRFASIQITKELFLILYLTSFRVTSCQSDCRLSLSVGLALFSSYRGFLKSAFVIRRQDPPLFMLSAPNPLA
jgi:hypothetical protein